MKLQIRLGKAAILGVVALTLVACGTSTSPSVAPLKEVVGTDLPGAQGKTREDQGRIDSAMAGLCGAGVYKGSDLCALHTKASADRLRELN